MKNPIPQFSIVIIALIAFTFLMGYTRPAAEEPKQYIVVHGTGGTPSKVKETFEKGISDKLAEGWRLQGGVSYSNVGALYAQAMVK